MNLNLRQIASKLSPKGWLAVGGSVLVGILFIYFLMSMASSPSYTTVVAGVQPAQTGKITSALSTAGIPYELQNNGTAVAVQTSDEAQARVALDTQGLLAGTGQSASLESLLGKTSLGESSQQTEEQTTSALEQQLQQQIETMNGINSAEVTLGIPDQADNLFSATNTQPTGSVLLNVNQQLGSTAVKSIAEMVAATVPGLNADKVTVSDQMGDLLWPSSSSTATSASAKESTEQAYDQAAAAKADSLLEATVGPGKALVQVSADLNTNQETQDSVTYGAKGTPLTSNVTKETLNGSGANTAGAAGNTATQTAAGYASTTGGGNSKYSNTSNQTSYGVPKTVSHTVISPGAINNQHIAVLLNSNVPKSAIPAIQAAVENAVGYMPKRDTISVGTIPFAKMPAASTGSSSSKMMGDVKYVVIGIAALAFLFFMTRMLKRRENENFAGNPTWLRELDGPRPLAQLEAERQMIDVGEPTVVQRLRPPVNLAKQQVEDLVDRDPERVASQVRQWMTED